MDSVINKLKEITNCNSNSILDLFAEFEKIFPNEKNIILLLRTFLFSEEKCSPDLVINALNQVKSRRD